MEQRTFSSLLCALMLALTLAACDGATSGSVADETLKRVGE
jgi:hypothetical protein